MVSTKNSPSTGRPEPRRRLRAAKRALYREAILDGAERVFARAGYEDAKVQDIAEASGISLSTLYAVFPKKWEIFRSVQERRLGELMGRIAERAISGDAFDMLRAGFETYLAFHMEHPHYLQMHLRERNAWATTDELRSDAQTAAWQTGLQMMIQAIRTGIDEGIFLDDDPELMARTAVAAHQVRLALWIDRGQREPPASILRWATEQVIRTMCRPERGSELRARAGLA